MVSDYTVSTGKQLYGRILITGGAGFLGRGIMRRAKAENWETEFVIYSRDEYKQALCKRKFPNATYILGDVRDTDRLSIAMSSCSMAIHAAALKYVPEAERNISECLAVNVGGTQSAIRAAHLADISTLVLISTDKATEPQNTYGLSKALAERLMLEASRDYDDTVFATCRYGNVIGSTGSVVPVFKASARCAGLP
jgi:UDP-N-acetylglucosamine 4,6-dehydratase